MTARITIGAAVFVAILCGQPDMLAVICLYLWAAIAVVGGIIRVGQTPDSHRHRPAPVE
ncbi:MAG: hypothetical protein ACREF6_01225 [Alphaproteobacteria bacterium]